jgi:hypothetical protein
MEGMLCDEELIMRPWDLTKGSKIENFLEKIKKYYHPEWFMNQTASWNTNFRPIFTESITKGRGYGFSFNMLEDSKLFSEK